MSRQAHLPEDEEPGDVPERFREATEFVAEHADGPLAEIAEEILHSFDEDEEVSRS
ncbi:hypothetical protein [Natronorarus salvus]|uniref:hypothetical protein n=1 Tax=Natronorarus salvus TaxID=3117733 RepID=UPI002F262775